MQRPYRATAVPELAETHGRPLVLAARRTATADLPPGEPAEPARNALRPGARGVVGRLQPDVAAAPASAPQPPPGAPDRAGTWVQVQIGTVPAAHARHGHRPAGIGTRPRRHAELRPTTGHGNLLVLAGAVPCTSKKEPRSRRCAIAGTARSQLPGSGATLSHYASTAHPDRPYAHRRPGDPWSSRRGRSDRVRVVVGHIARWLQDEEATC
jgi:hypothetical protein